VTVNPRRFGLTPNQLLVVVLVLVTAVSFAVRFVASVRQGLDIDEVFSLAIATGHSIEQPADKSRLDLGDFMQSPSPQPPATYRRYAAHDADPAGPSRVIRAVYLSDTNPPLYYLVLNLWTRLAGTSDMALRLLSVILATLCVPLIYVLGAQLYGRRTGLISAVFIGLAPQSVYYGALGRMYPLLGMIVLATAILTLRIHRRGIAPGVAAAWIGLSAAGLLTHYFFVFAWLAMCLWLFAYNHRAKRGHFVGMIVVVLLAIAPWYVQVPSSIKAWRVTKGWLEHRPAGFNPIVAQARLFTGYFSVGGDWLNRRGPTDYIIAAGLALAIIAALVWMPRLLRSKASQLLIVWLLASNAGLLIFDLLQHTYARQQSRYAFVAMPAAMILLAAIVARFPLRLRAATVVLLMALWMNGLRRLNAQSWGDNPFREIAESINANPVQGRVVVVHAIPTGVIGMSRYLSDSTAMIDWVEALGSRTTDDAAHITAGARAITLVKAPAIGLVPEERYFSAYSTGKRITRGKGYEMTDFVLASPAR